MRQLLEVKRQGVGRHLQLGGQVAGGQPRRARHHQRTEDPQAHLLGQGCEGSDNIGFLHESIIQRLLNY